jgi:CRP-like cAMP-binding protein
MWGDRAAVQMVQERMKLLLESHHQEMRPQLRTFESGALVLRQGEPARSVLLLTQGRVAIQLRQLDEPPHTLAVVEAEELIGEMGLFGSGVHSADVRVIDGPAELVEINGDEFLRTLLFDVDLAMELLGLVSQRCARSNEVIGLLLSGIAAAHRGDGRAGGAIAAALEPLDHCLAKAADRLEELNRLSGHRSAPAG